METVLVRYRCYTTWYLTIHLFLQNINIFFSLDSGINTKKFVEAKTRKNENARRRRLEFASPSKRAKKSKGASAPGPDEHYGLLEEAPADDLTPDQVAEKINIFMAGLHMTQEKREELERQTILQANCHLWLTYRRKILTASWFGVICKMRPTTSCRLTVYGILYGSFSNKATDHGIVNEPIAKARMEEVHGIVAMPCGLFIDEKFPFIGASPGLKTIITKTIAVTLSI